MTGHAHPNSFGTLNWLAKTDNIPTRDGTIVKGAKAEAVFGDEPSDSESMMGGSRTSSLNDIPNTENMLTPMPKKTTDFDTTPKPGNSNTPETTRKITSILPVRLHPLAPNSPLVRTEGVGLFGKAVQRVASPMSKTVSTARDTRKKNEKTQRDEEAKRKAIEEEKRQSQKQERADRAARRQKNDEPKDYKGAIEELEKANCLPLRKRDTKCAGSKDAKKDKTQGAKATKASKAKQKGELLSGTDFTSKATKDTHFPALPSNPKPLVKVGTQNQPLYSNVGKGKEVKDPAKAKVDRTLKPTGITVDIKQAQGKGPSSPTAQRTKQAKSPATEAASPLQKERSKSAYPAKANGNLQSGAAQLPPLIQTSPIQEEKVKPTAGTVGKKAPVTPPPKKKASTTTPPAAPKKKGARG
jgi:hypothetical protein